MDGKEHLLTLSQQSLQYKQGQPSQRRRQKSLKNCQKLSTHRAQHLWGSDRQEAWRSCQQREGSSGHHHRRKELSTKRKITQSSSNHHHHHHNSPKREESPNHHLIIIIIFIIVQKRGESPSQPRRGERAQGGTTSCQFWENPRLQGMFDWFGSGLELRL